MELDPLIGSTIFEHIPHGIFTVDPDGRITSFNRAAERLTGWKRKEVLGTLCSQVFRASHCERACFLRQSIAHGHDHRDEEVTITRRDGSEMLVSVSTANLEDANGQVIGGVEMVRDLSMVAALRQEIEGRYTRDDIISKSPSMRGTRQLAQLVAKSTSTALIEGEPGTGKELIARAIHNLGARRDGPFVAVNCGALPETLAESELFGYVKGAFTDASKDKPGRFALAEGGTLLLDEIGEISQTMQVKLLRVLQEREYTPLGAVNPVRADVRILAATNRDLAADVGAGRFRQDLFFRLNIIRIHVPPLRARTEDIPLLVDCFIKKFNALQGRRITGITSRAMALLMRHDWPGNVRELENAIEHAFVICAGAVIEREDLPPHLLQGPLEAGTSAAGESEAGRLAPLQSAEAIAIREALSRNDGNRTRAAQELGISRNTLWRKMKRYDIQ